MQCVELGQMHSYLPGQYDQVGKLGKGTDYSRLGKVVYINKPHSYFVLETVTGTGNKYREAFKFSQIHKGLIR